MKPIGVDDGAVGHEQARRLRATMVAAGIDRERLWLTYFSIGGDVSEFEVDAYLHHSLPLPRLQRDMLAQAANEILADMVPPRAPYTADLLTDRAPPERDSEAKDQKPSARDRDLMDREDRDG